MSAALESVRVALRQAAGGHVRLEFGLPLQSAVLYRTTPRLPPPPLPALLTPGARNADVRVKLWLWSLVLANLRARATARPARLDERDLVPPRLLIRLGLPTGLDDRRRLRRALDRLVSDGRLETLEDGRFNVCRETYGYVGDHLDAESQHAAAYNRRWAERPLSIVNSERVSGHPNVRNRFDVPLVFWWNGWFTVLDYRSVVVLFMLRHLGPSETVWYRVPRVLRDRYALTADVWGSGLRMLYAYRLVDVRDVGDRKVPERWVRPCWDMLNTQAVAPRADRSEFAQLERAPGTKKPPFRRVRSISDLPGRDIEADPLPRGRPIDTLELLESQHVGEVEAFLRRLSAREPEAFHERDSLLRLLYASGPGTIEQLVRGGGREQLNSTRRRAHAHLEALTRLGWVVADPTPRGAVETRTYRLSAVVLEALRVNPDLE